MRVTMMARMMMMMVLSLIGSIRGQQHGGWSNAHTTDPQDYEDAYEEGDLPLNPPDNTNLWKNPAQGNTLKLEHDWKHGSAENSPTLQKPSHAGNVKWGSKENHGFDGKFGNFGNAGHGAIGNNVNGGNHGSQSGFSSHHDPSSHIDYSSWHKPSQTSSGNNYNSWNQDSNNSPGNWKTPTDPATPVLGWGEEDPLGYPVPLEKPPGLGNSWMAGGVQADPAGSWGEPLEARPYCAVRSPGPSCCPGRDDQCTMPILDTICYCDHFCNRTQTDCCPDFLPFCMGIHELKWTTTPAPRPPLGGECIVEGRRVQEGQTVKINCNNCTCEMVGWKGSAELRCTERVCLIRSQILERVNSANLGWKATNYSSMWGLTLEEGIKYRLGTLQPPPPVTGMTPLKVKPGDEIPERFDWREKSPSALDPIQDQGNCAASWAFSSTSVAADRLRLHSEGSVGVSLSAQQLVSCSPEPSGHGCEGGRVDRAWWYLWKVGVVTEDCYSYISGSDHDPGKCLLSKSVMTGGREGSRGRPIIEINCSPPQASIKSSRVYQISPPYRIAPNEREIMKEILDNGPVQATIKVREDFYAYRSGVYQYSMPADSSSSSSTSGKPAPSVGYQAVKIIGWGSEYINGRQVKYWICSNVWGTSWGEDGYFRIVRGVNESGVESFVIGVWAKVDGRLVGQRSRGSRLLRARRYRRR